MWVALHAELIHHPKLSRLARYLGVPRAQALGHLAGLWCWCAEYAEDGSLSSFEPEEIAEGAMWEGDPAAFVSALEKAGFLDTGPDGRRTIHNWEEYSGRIRAAREAARERQARHRARDKSVTEPLQERDTNVTRRDCHAPGGEGIGGDWRGLEQERRGGAEGSEPPSAPAATAADNSPSFEDDGFCEVLASWAEIKGDMPSTIETSFLRDLIASAGGDAGIVGRAIQEAAISAKEPSLKFVGSIARRLAGSNWHPVGAAATVRVQPAEGTYRASPQRVDRRRPIPISELPEYSQRNHI